MHQSKNFASVFQQYRYTILEKTAFLSDQNEGFPLNDDNNTDCKYSHAPVDIFAAMSKQTDKALELIGIGDDAEPANDWIETKIMR